MVSDISLLRLNTILPKKKAHQQPRGIEHFCFWMTASDLRKALKSNPQTSHCASDDASLKAPYQTVHPSSPREYFDLPKRINMSVLCL